MVDKSLEIGLAVLGWYLTSFSTLLLNKYLLESLHIAPNSLACVQMVSTAIYGALKTVKWRDLLSQAKRLTDKAEPVDLEDPAAKDQALPSTTRRKCLVNMCFVGAMRFSTVVLGLVSLKYVAASFTETIKASAPFFTVIIAFFMLGERTSSQVVLSLIPIAGGLVMVSFTELSFNMIGFGAAVSTNVIECVQNVFSKRLLARDFTPSQLQFYTSVTALVLQAPILLYNALASAGPEALVMSTVRPAVAIGTNATVIAVPVTATTVSFITGRTLFLLWIDGVFYHLQSVVAYVVMSHLSPVTVSVINTMKRALIIWISVLVFGNEVTHWAKLGTFICLLGTLAYNYLRQIAPAAHKS